MIYLNCRAGRINKEKKMLKKMKEKNISCIVFLFVFLIVLIGCKLITSFSLLTLFYFAVVNFYFIRYILLKIS